MVERAQRSEFLWIRVARRSTDGITVNRNIHRNPLPNVSKWLVGRYAASGGEPSSGIAVSNMPVTCSPLTK